MTQRHFDELHAAWKSAMADNEFKPDWQDFSVSTFKLRTHDTDDMLGELGLDDDFENDSDDDAPIFGTGLNMSAHELSQALEALHSGTGEHNGVVAICLSFDPANYVLCYDVTFVDTESEDDSEEDHEPYTPWVQMHDDNGDAYYLNEVSHETTWDAPSDFRVLES